MGAAKQSVHVGGGDGFAWTSPGKAIRNKNPQLLPLENMDFQA